MNMYERMGDTVIVYMPGEIDDYTAGKMTEGTEEVFSDQIVRHAIFDFSRTTFMDSSGIGLITRSCCEGCGRSYDDKDQSNIK